MTNPQPPQWLIDELADLAEELINYDQRMTDAGAPDVRFTHKYTKKAAAAITAKFEQAVGRDEYTMHHGLVGEVHSDTARNELRSEQRIAWYTDASREGDKNDNVR